MAAKKKPTPPSPSLIEGRLPPPLPSVEGPLASLVEELRTLEALDVEPKNKFDVNKRRQALVAGQHDGSRTFPPADVRRLIELVGFDLGEYPQNVDYSKAKTRPQMKKLDEAYQALLFPSLAREETLKVLFALASVDRSFQEEMLPKLASLPRGAQLQQRLFEAIVHAPKLAPLTLQALRDRARQKDLLAIATAAGAFFARGPDVAYAELAPLLSTIDRKSTADLEYAKTLIDSGNAGWAAAPSAWREILAPLAQLEDSPYDFNRLNEWRAETQLGASATAALAKLGSDEPRAAAKPVGPEPETRAARAPRAESPTTPVDGKKLKSARAREAALDALGAWFVENLANATDDDAVRAVMRAAIVAFYDVREAADQPRGEYAGHFFMVDAVGLDDSDRPVPWEQLAAKLPEARMTELAALFDEVERACE